VLNGPRLAQLVRERLPPMQGQLKLGAAGLGVTAVPALLLGRPVPFTLDDVEVLDPEGTVVLRAAHVSAAVQVGRSPWRITIHDLRPGRGTWRMATMREHSGIGFLAAFQPPRRPRPAGPTPPRPAPPRAPAPAPRFAFAIAGAQLDGLDATFDFPPWGLVLNDVKAAGGLSLELTGAGRPILRFDVRSIDARRGGSLRILGGPDATLLPLDRARLARVGTAEGAPTDLFLEVEEGLTGTSRLSGRALFPSLFGRRADGRRGMELEAAWERAGDALEALARGRGLGDLKIAGPEARLRTKLRSSFSDVDGVFHASGLDVTFRGYRVLDLALDASGSGPPFQLAVASVGFRSPSGGAVQGSGTLAASSEVRGRLQFERLKTDGSLPEYLRPLVGGVLGGYVGARADLRGQTAALEALSLRLDRNRRGPLPRSIHLYSGAAPPPPEPGVGEPAMSVAVQSLRYAGGAILLGGSSMAVFGGRLSARGQIALRAAADGVPLSPPRLDLEVEGAKLDLQQALPGLAVEGPLSFRAAARGPLDDVGVRVRFPSGTALTLAGEPYALPDSVNVRVRGERLVLPALRLGPPGGGSLEARGWVVVDRALELDVTLRDHQLARLPGLGGSGLPLSGRLGGRLSLRGLPQRPLLSGQVSLEEVRVRERPMGGGTLDLRPAGPGVALLEGQLFDSLKLAGRMAVGPGGPTLDASMQVKGFALDSFLPAIPLLPEAHAVVSGRLALQARPRAPPQVQAELSALRLTYACGAPSCVSLESAGPVVARASGDHLVVEESRLRIRPAALAILPVAVPAAPPEGDFSVAGRLDGDRVAGAVKGRIDLALLEPLFRPLRIAVTGAVEADLAASGDLAAPAVKGALTVRDPVQVRPASGRVAAAITGGTLELGGNRLRSSGLSVVIDPGARVKIAGEGPLVPGAGPVALSLDGEVDASVLERLLPEAVASARGTARVSAEIGGTPERPSLRGRAELGPLDLRLRWQDTAVRVRGGSITADRQVLTLSGVIADLPPRGRLVVGPPGKPATVVIRSFDPLVLGDLRATVLGEDLAAELPALSLKDADVELRLTGDAGRGPLTLAGTGRLEEGRFKAREAGKASAAASASTAAKRKRARAAGAGGQPLPAVRLDLRITSDGKRFVIDPGWLPDMHMGLDIHVGGTAEKPAVTWAAKPNGLLEAIALFFFKLFS
jgi:hypothetical protein